MIEQILSSKLFIQIKLIAKSLIYFLIGYLIILPLTFLVFKKQYIVFIPRFYSSFSGNVKYMYSHLRANEEVSDMRLVFLSESKDHVRYLNTNGIDAVYYPSLKAIYILLATKFLFVEGNEWVNNLKFHFLLRSKKIQLWHGTGIKSIGKSKKRIKNQDLKKRLYLKAVGDQNRVNYSIACFTSHYQLKLRGDAFNADYKFVNGQPRNDVLDGEIYNGIEKVGADGSLIDELARNFSNHKIIGYMPTWRKEDFNSSIINAIEFNNLNSYLADNNMVMVVKFHSKHFENLEVGTYSNIVEYEKYKDVYPLFSQLDLLITDYSSIYTDYLLLRKPIIFFPYDYDKYVNKERDLQVDYVSTSPGPICYDYKQLISQLDNFRVKNGDGFADERHEMLEKYYEYKGFESAKRLWAFINETN